MKTPTKFPVKKSVAPVELCPCCVALHTVDLAKLASSMDAIMRVSQVVRPAYNAILDAAINSAGEAAALLAGSGKPVDAFDDARVYVEPYIASICEECLVNNLAALVDAWDDFLLAETDEDAFLAREELFDLAHNVLGIVAEAFQASRAPASPMAVA